MTSSPDFKRDEISEKLFQIYTDDNRDLLISIQNIIAPKAEYLSDFFYAQLLEIEESNPFLSHEVVSERLHGSMTKWIKTLFLPIDEHSVADHIKWQKIIGDVHARINVPMRLVNHGVRLLKGEITKLILEAEIDLLKKCLGIVLINDLLDFSLSQINETYILHRINHENNSQALKMHLMSFSLIVELERLRSSLFDWLRRTVMDIYEKYPEEKPALSSAYNTEFGLWVTYKAELLFAERSDWVNKLKDQLQNIQENIDKINRLSEKDLKAEFSLAIEYLSESISNTAWLLSDFSTQAYELESGKDTLTRLFNRRFLASVMQNMIKSARSSSSTFSVIVCDLDDFKQINDRYGHEAGDKALVAFGDFLVSNIRVTDYVFRMGGDEFLAILAGANSQTSIKVAEKILEQLKVFAVKVDENTTIFLQTSIGAVQYNGHPDYVHILKDADDALYQAKKLGRNTYYLKP